MNDVKKNTVQNRVEMRKKMDGQSQPSNVTLHKIVQNSSFFWAEKNHRCFGTVLSLEVFFTTKGMSRPLSHVLQFCNMGKEQNLEVELLDATQD